MHDNRLTADQLAALAPGPPSPLESRFDRDDGSQIGDRGWLLDTEQVDQWVAGYGAALASLADDEYDDAHRNPEGGH